MLPKRRFPSRFAMLFSECVVLPAPQRSRPHAADPYLFHPWVSSRFGTSGFSVIFGRLSVIFRLRASCYCFHVLLFRFLLAPGRPKLRKVVQNTVGSFKNQGFDKCVSLHFWLAFGHQWRPFGLGFGVVGLSGALLDLPWRHKCRCRFGQIEIFLHNGFPRALVDAKRGAGTPKNTLK